MAALKLRWVTRGGPYGLGGGREPLRCVSALGVTGTRVRPERRSCVKALVWFWLIDETLSANLVYQSDYEICSTTPSDEATSKIMTMVMAW